MRKCFLLICLALTSTIVLAQPKRELRGAWVATVSNIDWPSSKTLTVAQQQSELIAILNQHQQAGLNAVFFQIRSQCDALYNSSIEPWADVLNGLQGSTSSYDPLQFVIDECRKRNLEIHAWFNPYRAVINATNLSSFATNHIARTRPDLLLSQGNLRVLDPGQPEVNTYIIRVVMDVLRRYDVDGIHFDDYFYPYPPGTGVTPFNDDATFAAFPRGISNKNDWRRANIDSLIKRTNDSIKLVKPWVKFGISPFGIWQNFSTSQPNGSNTSGLQSFNDIYANSRLWLQQQWVDYMAPQIYWSMGFSAANYSVLVPWWNGNANGRHIYSGMAAYKVNADSDPNWSSNTQIPNQIRFNRTHANILGAVFYNTKSVNNNPLGMRDSLRLNLFNLPAIVPAMGWKDNIAPARPTSPTISLASLNATIGWTRPTQPSAEMDKIRSFVVYRSETTPVDINNPANIRKILPYDSTAYVDLNLPVDKGFYYVITALDRLANESPVSDQVFVSTFPTAINPVNGAYAALFTVNPNPFANTLTITYEVKTAGLVQLKLIDLQGKTIDLILHQQQQPAKYTHRYASVKLAPAQYYVQLSIGKNTYNLPIIKQ